MAQHSATVIKEGARETPVVAETDVLVVGGGPAGVCAAIAAARSGARVVLTERYPHLGGLASGGQVIVLDDMADRHEKTVGGLSDEIVDQLDALGGAVYPPVEDRFANVNVDEAIAWEQAHPVEYAGLDKEIKAIYGGSWEHWWLRTTVDGVVWCNCPHIPNLNALSVEDQTYVEHEARKRIFAALEFARKNLPGFQRAQLVDTAPQLGVRQTRLLRGEYVLTKQDVLERRWFADRIGRGRDYYYPYRTLLPIGVEGLLVAGRCFSATSDAQKMSREIPPMFVVGEAAGVAAALAVREQTSPRQLDVAEIQEVLRGRGALLGPDADPAKSTPMPSIAIGVSA